MERTLGSNKEGLIKTQLPKNKGHVSFPDLIDTDNKKNWNTGLWVGRVPTSYQAITKFSGMPLHD